MERQKERWEGNDNKIGNKRDGKGLSEKAAKETEYDWSKEQARGG